ncbi:MAG: amidohydrolase [Acidimicrobiia bacterium]|jgi:amidohydrolase
MPAPEDLARLVEAITPQAVKLRRRLHMQPEPAHREIATTELIRTTLESSGVVFKDRAPKTGGWVDIGTNPRVGFRADIDGLPIVEPAENDPRSQNEGWMHACGHDAHTAIAVGIAITLAQMEAEAGIRILFQPGEESNPGGAIELVSEGLVDELDAMLAFHVDPTLRAGRVGARSGPVTGSADSLRIIVHGPGGHTSRPHKTVDLVEAAGRVVTELPGAIRRAIDARTPIVTVFGSIRGGNAGNVIPTEVVIEGSVRTLDAETWDVLPGLIDKSLGAILALSGAGYTLDYRQGIPPVVNDGTVVGIASSAIEEEFEPGTVVHTEQSMGGEDFSNYLAVVPGALLRLGSASGGGDLHSAGFKVNEQSIGFGIQAGVSALLALADRT